MNEERLLKILLAPHMSEKSTNVSGDYHQYVFKVIPDASKPEIKKAVEHVFDVKVSHVCTSNVKSKAAGRGKTIGRHKAWKKAYITLGSDQEIDVASVQ